MQARVSNATILEILTAAPGYSLDECFHHSIIDASVTVPDNAVPGWTLVGGSWGPPPVPPPPTTDQLKQHAAAVRFEKETAGVDVGGIKVETDRGSQAMINGAFTTAKDDSTFTTKWKASDGGFVSLSNATILSLGRAVSQYVNACFSKEADVCAGIDAHPPTISSIADIEAAFDGVGS